MKILFVGRNDWANIANRIARAMNCTPGAPSARVLTANAHPFGYVEDMVIARRTHRGLFDWAAEADWLVSTGDGDYEFFAMMQSFLPLPSTVRLATMHVGSAYRSNPHAYEEADKDLGFEIRFIGADLFRFASEKAIPYFAPPDTVATGLSTPREITVSHSPTNRANKGTNEILTALEMFGGRARIDLIEGVSYAECARRRADSQIFVDQMSSIGGFGASSVEALAAGCAVLADISNVADEVWEFFPRPPIINAGTPMELLGRIEELLADPTLLLERRRASLTWAQDHASSAAVARYFQRYLQ